MGMLPGEGTHAAGYAAGQATGAGAVSQAPHDPGCQGVVWGQRPVCQGAYGGCQGAYDGSEGTYGGQGVCAGCPGVICGGPA
jgi:hypothetical protein